MITLLSRTDLGIAIKSIGTDARNLQERIHQAACSGLDHVREFGDYMGVLDLLNALPRGQRVQGLAVWLKHFSNKKLSVRLDSKTKVWVADLDKDRDDSDFDIAGAMEINFGEFSPEPIPNTLTVEKLLKYLAKQAINTDTNKDGTDKVTEDARNLATKLLAVAKSKAA